MSPDGALRLEDTLALLPEEELQSLAKRFDCRDTISELRSEIGTDAPVIQARIDALDEDAQEALQHLAAVVPPRMAPEVSLSEPVERLVEAGLAFCVSFQQDQRLMVPLEVQVLLSEQTTLADPDLRILLLHLDEPELTRFEGLYQVDTTDDEDTSGDTGSDYGSMEADEVATVDPADDGLPARLARVCALAEAMESRATLREVYQSLPDTSQEVLGWTCEHAGPLGQDEVQDLARDAALYYQDRAGIAVAQLVRFGLLMSHELPHSGEVYLVPRSIRHAVISLIDQQLTLRAQTQYETLVTEGHLSFPDEGPHGWGGDALRGFRQLTINWASGRLEELPPEYGVAVGMQIIDPEQNRQGAFASLLLDLSGETAFSRQSIRLWLALIDDPWSVALINATGGDSDRLVEYLSADPPEGDPEIWFGHLFLLRAQLILTLSLLPPGKWFPIASLARLFHSLVARSTVANLTHETLSRAFPYEALPDYGVVIARENRLKRIQDWLEGWLNEFGMVVGAAEVDRSGTYFRVHPDAFCVFRDSDLWFRTVWEDLSPVVGDDLDIWMPIPNDPGPRVSGVAEFRVTGQRRIGLARGVHLFDLIRLAKWATPVPEASGYGFEFTTETIRYAVEQGLDSEEMLLWLAVRSHGDLPLGLRVLFPQSSSPADGPPEHWHAATTDRISELLLSLENWGSSPPSQLLEEIRSWGTLAGAPLTARVHSLIDEGRLDEPMLQHASILLGELGVSQATPALMRVIESATPELIKHAAAAACMRIGEPCLGPLEQLLSNSKAPKDQRLVAAMAVTGLATLHPFLHRQIGANLSKVIDSSAYDGDLQTRLTLELCRMGHNKSESMIELVQSEDNWTSSEWRPEDALWLVRVSPCVWGSLLFSTPMAMLYLVSDEADELARESGVRDLLKNAGLSSESMLYGRPRPNRD